MKIEKEVKSTSAYGSTDDFVFPGPFWAGIQVF